MNADFFNGMLQGIAVATVAWILITNWMANSFHNEWMSLANRYEDALKYLDGEKQTPPERRNKRSGLRI